MKDWTIRGSHYVLELPEGRELHIDASTPLVEGWFHRPGIEPLRVATGFTQEETRVLLIDLAEDLLRRRRYGDGG